MVACTAVGVIRCPVFGSTASPPASGYDSVLGVAAGTLWFPDRVTPLLSLMFSPLKTAVAGGTFPRWGEPAIVVERRKGGWPRCWSLAPFR